MCEIKSLTSTWKLQWKLTVSQLCSSLFSGHAFYDSVSFVFKFSRQKKWSQKECTISFCLQHRNSSWKGNCALHFSNRRRKRSCPLKLGRMGVQVSMVGLDMLSFLIFNRWKLLPVVESAALLAHRNICWEWHCEKLPTGDTSAVPTTDTCRHHPSLPQGHVFIYLFTQKPTQRSTAAKNWPPEKCQCTH